MQAEKLMKKEGEMQKQEIKSETHIKTQTTKKSIIDIPDMIDTEKEDKSVEKIRNENKGKEEKEEQKRGKCGCLIF